MDVGHNVVAQLLLLLLGQVIVDVVLLPLQLVDLPLGDGQAQFHLRPGQGNPQPAPGGEFLVRGEQIKHLPAGVAGGQRTFICIFSHNIVPSLSIEKKPNFERRYYSIKPTGLQGCSLPLGNPKNTEKPLQKITLSCPSFLCYILIWQNMTNL